MTSESYNWDLRNMAKKVQKCANDDKVGNLFSNILIPVSDSFTAHAALVF